MSGNALNKFALDFIKEHGRGDGQDEDRLRQAFMISGEVDISWKEMFKRLLSLEDKGLIELKTQRVYKL